MSSTNIIDGDVRQTQGSDLPGSAKVGHRGDGVLDRGPFTAMVQVVEIDDVDVEPAESPSIAERTVAGSARTLQSSK